MVDMAAGAMAGPPLRPEEHAPAAVEPESAPHAREKEDIGLRLAATPAKTLNNGKTVPAVTGRVSVEFATAREKYDGNNNM